MGMNVQSIFPFLVISLYYELYFRFISVDQENIFEQKTIIKAVPFYFQVYPSKSYFSRIFSNMKKYQVQQFKYFKFSSIFSHPVRGTKFQNKFINFFPYSISSISPIHEDFSQYDEKIGTNPLLIRDRFQILLLT